MGRILVFILLAVVIAFVLGRSALRARRRKADTTPELHKHPERLDQNLDPTDDA